EWRAPTWDKAVFGIERAEAREERVDQPEIITTPTQFVPEDVSRDKGNAGEETCIVLTPRLDLPSDIRCIAKIPNLVPCAKNKLTRTSHSQSHRPLKSAQQSPDASLSLAHSHKLACLVRGHEQRNSLIFEQLG